MANKLLKIAIGAAIAGVAFKLGRDKFRETKQKYEQEERATEGDVIRKYTAFFDRKLVEAEEGPFEGCELKAFSAKLILDLSRVSIEKDVYISFDAKGSTIEIILPSGVNVETDVSVTLGRMNDYSVHDDSIPHTIHIVGNATASTLEIVPEYVYLDNDEDEEYDDFQDVIDAVND